jgi:antirestriction protein ArdC
MKKSHAKPAIDEQQIRAGIAAATDQLLKEIQAGHTEHLTRLLTFASRFHKYSPLNQLAIMLQCPDATHVAGFRTWERMGYHVAKGQKGIRILAPRPYERLTETGDVEKKIAFRLISVFDASQLSPEDVAKKPLPTFYRDLGTDEESETLYAHMRASMTAAGISVEERDASLMPAGTQGFSTGGQVVLRAGMPARNRCRTLAHEWAHELLHQGEANADYRAKTTKAQRECHAEATSFTVLAHFGIHNDLSSDYLHTWGATAELLNAELAMVQRAASQIIGALEAKQEDATDEQEDDETTAA